MHLTHGQLDLHGCTLATGAKARGHHYPQFWSNINWIGSVLQRNITFAWNNIKKYFFNKWPSCFRVNPIYQSSHPFYYYSPKREKVYYINDVLWVEHIAMLFCYVVKLQCCMFQSAKHIYAEFLCGETFCQYHNIVFSKQANMPILSCYEAEHYIHCAFLCCLTDVKVVDTCWQCESNPALSSWKYQYRLLRLRLVSSLEPKTCLK